MWCSAWAFVVEGSPGRTVSWVMSSSSHSRGSWVGVSSESSGSRYELEQHVAHPRVDPVIGQTRWPTQSNAQIPIDTIRSDTQSAAPAHTQPHSGYIASPTSRRVAVACLAPAGRGREAAASASARGVVPGPPPCEPPRQTSPTHLTQISTWSNRQL